MLSAKSAEKRRLDTASCNLFHKKKGGILFRKRSAQLHVRRP